MHFSSRAKYENEMLPPVESHLLTFNLPINKYPTPFMPQDHYSEQGED